MAPPPGESSSKRRDTGAWKDLHFITTFFYVFQLFPPASLVHKSAVVHSTTLRLNKHLIIDLFYYSQHAWKTTLNNNCRLCWIDLVSKWSERKLLVSQDFDSFIFHSNQVSNLSLNQTVNEKLLVQLFTSFEWFHRTFDTLTLRSLHEIFTKNNLTKKPKLKQDINFGGNFTESMTEFAFD